MNQNTFMLMRGCDYLNNLSLFDRRTLMRYDDNAHWIIENWSVEMSKLVKVFP